MKKKREIKKKHLSFPATRKISSLPYKPDRKQKSFQYLKPVLQGFLCKRTRLCYGSHLFLRYEICQAKLSHSSDRQLDFSSFNLPSLAFFAMDSEIRIADSWNSSISRDRRRIRSIDAIRWNRHEIFPAKGWKTFEMTTRNGCSPKESKWLKSLTWSMPLLVDHFHFAWIIAPRCVPRFILIHWTIVFYGNYLNCILKV